MVVVVNASVGCPVAIGAPVEAHQPVAGLKIEVAIGVGSHPLVAASVGGAAVFRYV